MIIVKVTSTENKIFINKGDDAIAKQFALASQLAAIAAGKSEMNAGASEQVATQKAAQTVEDAASALASKQDAEIAATASGGFATDSGISATASNTAKGLSEAAKVIAIEEAGKSSTSAGQSDASAAAAEASSSLITNKAEVNIATAGNILRADGTKFKSISEVEFLRSTTPFDKSYLAGFLSPKTIYAWDNFTRADGNPVASDNGIAYTVGANTIISGNKLVSNSRLIDLILPYGFGGFEIEINFSFSGLSGNNYPTVGFQIYKDAQNFVDFNFVTGFFRVAKSVAGIMTVVQNLNDSTPFLGSNGNNFKLFGKLIFNANNRTFIVYIKVPSNQSILTVDLSADAQITTMFPTKQSIGIRLIGTNSFFAETATSINSYIIKY